MAPMTTLQGPEGLVGLELSAVAFVRDYVEFHFDGPILRALSSPLIRTEGHESQFPDPGSRDALCTLIGQSVASVQVVWSPDTVMGKERIELALEDAMVVIPLDLDHRVGPESAHYVPSHPDGSPALEGMHIW